MRRTAQLAPGAEAVAAWSESGKVTVLLIDQSSEDIESIKRLLSRANISVKTATDLDMGLSLIDKEIEAIIMDLDLPYSQGFDTFEVVSDYSTTTPVIVLTKNQDKELALKAMRYGAQDYLFKETINSEVLVRSIRYAIERKALVEEQKSLKFGVGRSGADIERFLYVAATELSPPLESLMKHLRFLESGPAQVPSAKSLEEGRYLALKDSMAMQGIINDLLGFAKVGVEGRSFERFDMEEALHAALVELRPLMERTGTTLTQDPLPNVFGDRAQITLLLHNLIETAMQFRGTDPLQVRVSAREGPKEWKFTIKDNSVGIPEALQGLVHGDFVNVFAGATAREHPGAGIRILISKRVVERHGGSMSVLSEDMGGTAFHFTIPKERSGEP